MPSRLYHNLILRCQRVIPPLLGVSAGAGTDLTEKAPERGRLGFPYIRSDILTQTHIASHSGLDVEFQAISPDLMHLVRLHYLRQLPFISKLQSKLTN
jgi:hypothetical protein